MRFAVLPGVALVSATALAGCVISVDSQAEIVREETRFTISGVPDLRLTTFDGSIEIQSWDRDEVLVEIEKRGPTREAVAALDVVSTQDGNLIELEVKRPKAETLRTFGFHHSPSAKLIVSVPRKSNIRARTDDGSIRIERIAGTLELRTGDGSIRAQDVAGKLALNTGDGSITVERAEGEIVLDTGDGGVSVSGSCSRVKAHTGDGSIVYRAESGTTMTDNWEVTTGDGSVTLYLPSDFSADLDAHTGDGSISNDVDVVTTRSGEMSRRTVRGRIGDGGKLLRIRTGDGAIRLRRS